MYSRQTRVQKCAQTLSDSKHYPHITAVTPTLRSGSRRVNGTKGVRNTKTVQYGTVSTPWVFIGVTRFGRGMMHCSCSGHVEDLLPTFFQSCQRCESRPVDMCRFFFSPLPFKILVCYLGLVCYPFP